MFFSLKDTLNNENASHGGKIYLYLIADFIQIFIRILTTQ